MQGSRADLMLVQRRGTYLMLMQWCWSDRVTGRCPIGTGGDRGLVLAGEVGPVPVGTPGRVTILAGLADVVPVSRSGRGTDPMRGADLRLVTLRCGGDRSGPSGRGGDRPVLFRSG
ncbi:hypothetical protein Vlu01_19250 [Micromonospora lutea]|uniref:Uncharacterized protein n=1 Tax=Micromonospora lutea TaxID=419825 RepID=A0ABQ4ITQ4_9ACTN|nr:hypothetical protein Vlu01_19250 [Micromonospora lutea]